MLSFKKQTAAFLLLLTAPLYVLFRNLSVYRKKASSAPTTKKSDSVATKRDSAIDLDEEPSSVQSSKSNARKSSKVFFVDVPVVHYTYAMGASIVVKSCLVLLNQMNLQMTTIERLLPDGTI